MREDCTYKFDSFFDICPLLFELFFELARLVVVEQVADFTLGSEDGRAMNEGIDNRAYVPMAESFGCSAPGMVENMFGLSVLLKKMLF